MAIFYYRANVIARSAGQSACACAAYFAAARIECQRLRVTYDYTDRTGVDYSEIIVPVIADRQLHISRSQLWNTIEAIEKRPDSQLARSRWRKPAFGTASPSENRLFLLYRLKLTIAPKSN
ncbi:MobA/MobL family protein [Chamaesiphon minutus]|uniref:MobA/MobL family protein n=1 Tax=Chamaesiphon minutus (strain ATCC 27169 / PCC 6605) TaxID=1173020 RepID=K9UFC9_CHAP6|nr:MobA/MobL family protein [Chamaesiphon minutus]AFY92914.1 MobA/MobL family protein [Chamaesiphon minutus PCC 6605]